MPGEVCGPRVSGIRTLARLGMGTQVEWEIFGVPLCVILTKKLFTIYFFLTDFPSVLEISGCSF